MPFLSINTPLTVKLLAKKFAFSEKRIMFVVKLKMTITSVILFFGLNLQSSSKKPTNFGLVL